MAVWVVIVRVASSVGPRLSWPLVGVGGCFAGECVESLAGEEGVEDVQEALAVVLVELCELAERSARPWSATCSGRRGTSSIAR